MGPWNSGAGNMGSRLFKAVGGGIAKKDSHIICIYPLYILPRQCYPCKRRIIISPCLISACIISASIEAEMTQAEMRQGEIDTGVLCKIFTYS